MFTFFPQEPLLRFGKRSWSKACQAQPSLGHTQARMHVYSMQVILSSTKSKGKGTEPQYHNIESSQHDPVKASKKKKKNFITNIYGFTSLLMEHSDFKCTYPKSEWCFISGVSLYIHRRDLKINQNQSAFYNYR